MSGLSILTRDHLGEDLMLLKLLPEQVAKNWETFKDAIEASLPPVVGQASDRMNNILKSVLIGKVESWISFQEEEGLKKIDALMGLDKTDKSKILSRQEIVNKVETIFADNFALHIVIIN